MPKTPHQPEPPLEVGIRELRDRLSHFVSEVAAGRTIIVTDRGRAVARLTGIEAIPPGLQRMMDEGLVLMPTRSATSARTWPRIEVEGGTADLVDEQRR